MEVFFVVITVSVVLGFIAITWFLYDIYDLIKSMCSLCRHIDDCITLRAKEKKTDIDKVNYKKKYEKLKLRVKRLEELFINCHDCGVRNDDYIKKMDLKYKNIVDTIDEIVDDQLQQDAQHEKCINDMYKNFKILSDCLAKECGVAIDFYYPEDKREELSLNDE